MARFRATIKGARGQASRLGNAKSGLLVTANGWDCGISVEADIRDGVDIFHVWLTGGSNGHKSSRLIGTFSEADFATARTA